MLDVDIDEASPEASELDRQGSFRLYEGRQRAMRLCLAA